MFDTQKINGNEMERIKKGYNKLKKGKYTVVYFTNIVTSNSIKYLKTLIRLC